MNTLSSGYRKWIWPWWKHYLSPSTYYYYVKYKWQRANRGWADCDIWSLDCYLAEWLPDALQKLKQDKHGTPIQVFPSEPEYLKTDGNANELGWKIAIQKWDDIMTAMIEGFAAKCRLDSHEHLRRLTKDYNDDWLIENRQPSEKMKQIYAECDKLEAADRKIMEKGLSLFVEHFESLWD